LRKAQDLCSDPDPDVESKVRSQLLCRKSLTVKLKTDATIRQSDSRLSSQNCRIQDSRIWVIVLTCGYFSSGHLLMSLWSKEAVCGHSILDLLPHGDVHDVILHPESLRTEQEIRISPQTSNFGGVVGLINS
jgi:hypothetical protein